MNMFYFKKSLLSFVALSALLYSSELQAMKRGWGEEEEEGKKKEEGLSLPNTLKHPRRGESPPHEHIFIKQERIDEEDTEGIRSPDRSANVEVKQEPTYQDDFAAIGEALLSLQGPFYDDMHEDPSLFVNSINPAPPFKEEADQSLANEFLQTKRAYVQNPNEEVAQRFLAICNSEKDDQKVKEESKAFLAIMRRKRQTNSITDEEAVTMLNSAISFELVSERVKLTAASNLAGMHMHNRVGNLPRLTNDEILGLYDRVKNSPFVSQGMKDAAAFNCVFLGFITGPAVTDYAACLDRGLYEKILEELTLLRNSTSEYIRDQSTLIYVRMISECHRAPISTEEADQMFKQLQDSKYLTPPQKLNSYFFKAQLEVEKRILSGNPFSTFRILQTIARNQNYTLSAKLFLAIMQYQVNQYRAVSFPGMSDAHAGSILIDIVKNSIKPTNRNDVKINLNSVLIGMNSRYIDKAKFILTMMYFNKRLPFSDDLLRIAQFHNEPLRLEYLSDTERASLESVLETCLSKSSRNHLDISLICQNRNNPGLSNSIRARSKLFVAKRYFDSKEFEESEEVERDMREIVDSHDLDDVMKDEAKLYLAEMYMVKKTQRVTTKDLKAYLHQLRGSRLCGDRAAYLSIYLGFERTVQGVRDQNRYNLISKLLKEVPKKRIKKHLRHPLKPFELNELKIIKLALVVEGRAHGMTDQEAFQALQETPITKLDGLRLFLLAKMHMEGRTDGSTTDKLAYSYFLSYLRWMEDLKHTSKKYIELAKYAHVKSLEILNKFE